MNRFPGSRKASPAGEGTRFGRCHEYCQAAGKTSNLDNMKTLSALTEEVSKNNDQRQQKAKQIFLGIDAHLRSNQVARKKDNGGIQGVQSFGFAELLLFAQKQLQLAEEVYAVYEAGPLGYVLYRRLRELGIRA